MAFMFVTDRNMAINLFDWSITCFSPIILDYSVTYNSKVLSVYGPHANDNNNLF